MSSANLAGFWCGWENQKTPQHFPESVANLSDAIIYYITLHYFEPLMHFLS